MAEVTALRRAVSLQTALSPRPTPTVCWGVWSARAFDHGQPQVTQGSRKRLRGRREGALLHFPQEPMTKHVKRGLCVVRRRKLLYRTCSILRATVSWTCRVAQWASRGGLLSLCPPSDPPAVPPVWLITLAVQRRLPSATAPLLVPLPCEVSHHGPQKEQWLICSDYRRVNGVTRKDSYPLPRIDESLDLVSGSSWSSLISAVGITRSLSPERPDPRQACL